ncbi:MAG: hypothetical protein WC241_04950 [Candidatus Paceibacterota bacterium]|jgi:hypothetical protein
MNVVIHYGILGAGGCERRLGDLVRWLLDNGDQAWICVSGCTNDGLSIIYRQCGVPNDRLRVMPPGGDYETFALELLREVDADIIDVQWLSSVPEHFPCRAVYTIHGEQSLPPPGWFDGLISVETMGDHHPARTTTPLYREIWNWVPLERFPFQEKLGKGACFIGRSFKMVNAKKVAEHWQGVIDCYGSAVTDVNDLPSGMRWLGWVDPEGIIYKYRVVFASAQVALEAMAAGRLVIAGQDFQETVPAGHLVTPDNVAHLACNQFYSWDRGNPSLRHPTSKEVYEQFCHAMAHDLLAERRELRAWVEQHHDKDTQIRKIREFYQEVLA